MNIIEYQKQASRTCPSLGDEQKDLLHMTLGMQTEAAEVSDVFKKNLAYGREIDWINIKEEIGDQMWYIANFCNIKGWNLEDILGSNILKLKIRYPDKFTSDKAINRDLKAERQVLENGE